MKKDLTRRAGLFSSLLFSSLLLLTVSCQKYDLPEPPAFDTPQTKDGMIRLGRKLENPYTVENMRQAYANLVSQGVLKSGLVIDATHLYIRVLPATEQEMDEFENHLLQHLGETKMELLDEAISGHIFSYPLDYEILEGGTFFYDPQLPPGGITWQYTVVPVGYTMPPVQHEVLADLFLKCDFAIAEKSSRGFDQASWQLLETEALRLAGDSDAELLTQPGLKRSVPRWTPRGTIKVWDNDLRKAVPVYGAKVRARRWFRVRTDLTDSTGYFETGSINTVVRYSIIWERKYWDIRSGTFGQAKLKKPNLHNSRWDIIINYGESQRHAIIHRAAHFYYFEQNSIKRPTVRGRVKISYLHRQATGGHLGDANPVAVWGIIPDIRVFGINDGLWRSSMGIFATTIHELAHVSHWDLVGRLNFICTGTNVIESWARGVQWYLTRMVYPWYNGGDTKRPDYTQVVVDMVDTRNDDGKNNGSRYPIDQVEGYTMKQIEDALVGSLSWNQWVNNILNRYENETENFVVPLFNFWH